MKLFLCIIIAIAALLPAMAIAQADTPPATQPASTPATKPAGLTVAILDFTADVGGDSNLGKQIVDTLTATLSDQPGFALLDRASIVAYARGARIEHDRPD